MMFTDNSNINFHINEMHAEWEILPADFKAIFQKVKSGRGPSPEWISGDDEDAVKVRGLVGKLTNVGMKLLVKLFLTIVDIPIIKEHDKDS